MLYVLVPQRTERLRYVCEVLLKQLLGVPYELVVPGERTLPEGSPFLNYTEEAYPASLQVPNAGWLLETHIRPDLPEVRQGSIPQLFPATDSTSDLDYDLFSASFFLLTEYEVYQHQTLDQFGRYRLDAYLIAQLELDRLPLVHLYAQKLGKHLQARFPGLSIQPPQPKPDLLTVDVDVPWRYLHKPFPIQLGGFAKDLLSGNWGQLQDRWQAHRTGTDPHDTFAQIQNLCPPEQTRFFFLLDHHSPHDSRFSWRTPALRRLIKELHQAGYGTGIHPSYTSCEYPERLAAEVEQLSRILDAPIRHSRQHFLRYRTPGTFRQLIELGITHEYSACLYQSGGFPHGMATPFPWFDLGRNEITKLTRVPTLMMDRTLMQYLALSPEEAVVQVRALREQTQAVGGQWTFLFHNEALSERGEWIGWSEAMGRMVL
ncbi:MAG: polysaccharide deacetylase family protein [Bacteroidota bacterium]